MQRNRTMYAEIKFIYLFIILLFMYLIQAIMKFIVATGDGLLRKKGSVFFRGQK